MQQNRDPYAGFRDVPNFFESNNKRTNVTELVNEALHDVLVKYGKRKPKK